MQRNRTSKRLVMLSALAILAGSQTAESKPDVKSAVDLDGKKVDPFSAPGITVLLFVRRDCPISNRYAPEVLRLNKELSLKGVEFLLVYPNRKATPELIRKHKKDFSYPMKALRDPDHVLVDRIGATVTPEAAVLANGVVIYRGRIDNTYVSFGKQRLAPSTRDLQDSVLATLSGKPVTRAKTSAVGCYIADLK